jgi:hypothetical protein
MSIFGYILDSFNFRTSIYDINVSSFKRILFLGFHLIKHFVQERHELPTNFKRMLGPKLRRLVAREKVMKVGTFMPIYSYVILLKGTQEFVEHGKKDKKSSR